MHLFINVGVARGLWLVARLLFIHLSVQGCFSWWLGCSGWFQLHRGWSVFLQGVAINQGVGFLVARHC